MDNPASKIYQSKGIRSLTFLKEDKILSCSLIESPASHFLLVPGVFFQNMSLLRTKK